MKTIFTILALSALCVGCISAAPSPGVTYNTNTLAPYPTNLTFSAAQKATIGGMTGNGLFTNMTIKSFVSPPTLVAPVLTLNGGAQVAPPYWPAPAPVYVPQGVWFGTTNGGGLTVGYDGISRGIFSGIFDTLNGNSITSTNEIVTSAGTITNSGANGFAFYDRSSPPNLIATADLNGVYSPYGFALNDSYTAGLFWQGGGRGGGSLGDGTQTAATFTNDVNSDGWFTIYSKMVIVGTTNQVTFGATNRPPISSNVVWISVNVTGDTNQWLLPLYKK